jgi:histidine triad (HIT) family protein
MRKSNESDCVFCKIVRGEISQTILGESGNFIAIRDVKPQTPGHLLVIPKKHLVTLLDIPDDLGNELLKFTKSLASQLIDERFGTAFNLVMNNLTEAGQVVMHAHIHVIPRKEGDGLRFVAKIN